MNEALTMNRDWWASQLTTTPARDSELAQTRFARAAPRRAATREARYSSGSRFWLRGRCS